jgi:hypothetical protein
MRRFLTLSGVCVLSFASVALGQTPGTRPFGSGLKPSPGGSPTVAKPAAESAFSPRAGSGTRPSSSFQPDTQPAATNEESAAPASGFGSGSFNPTPRPAAGSNFQSGSANSPGSFRSNVVAPAETETRELAPATNSFQSPATSSTTRPYPTTGALAPTANPGTRSFGASTLSQPPRNPLPTQPGTGSRIASSTSSSASAPISAEVASPVADSLLKQSLQPRGQNELPGQPVALSQAIEHAGGGSSRIRAVQTYWKLVTKMTAYHAAIDDRNLFHQINSRQLAQHDRTALAAAQLGAEAAVHRAELDFVNTQHELASIAHFSEVDVQALPSDVPLVSEYRTHFTALYGGGSAPSGLRRIDRSMPYHLKNVRSQADAVVASQQAMQAAVAAVSSGETGVSSLLEVHRHYAAQRTEFTLAVYDYNAMIAEYALNVAPNQSPATIVGMLIKTKPATRSATIIRDDSSVRAVSAEGPIAADQAPILQPAHHERVIQMPVEQPSNGFSNRYPRQGEAAIENPVETAEPEADAAPQWQR